MLVWLNCSENSGLCHVQVQSADVELYIKMKSQAFSPAKTTLNRIKGQAYFQNDAVSPPSFVPQW